MVNITDNTHIIGGSLTETVSGTKAAINSQCVVHATLINLTQITIVSVNANQFIAEGSKIKIISKG